MPGAVPERRPGDMGSEVEDDSDESLRRVLRRRAARTLLRSLLLSATVVVGYFVLPLSSHLAVDTLLELLLGLGALSALLAWQVRQILRSPFPAVQAFAALAVALPLFLTLFAITYYLMGDAEPGTFSEPMTRLDSMYFTVTVFATVGFGDITAVSQGARAVATVQMVAGLVLVGLIARVIFGAVEKSRGRQGRGG